MRILSKRFTCTQFRALVSDRFPILSFAILIITGIGLANGPQYNVIYRFQGGQDGYYPAAAMIADKAGNLYGTTAYGGTSGFCEGFDVQGCGTVFQLTPPATAGAAWTETVLYRFQGGSDGAFPQAAMIADQAGNLYGTTANGGSANCSSGCGTVFRLERPATTGGAWNESLLHTFLGVPSGHGDGDAASPNGLVFDKSGNLYGMAYGGGHCKTDETGTYCYGAVYKLTAPASTGYAWSESILHRFDGPTGGPTGPTPDNAVNLYGTAVWGKFGFGMIFRLMPPGSSGGAAAASPVYNFQGGSDGAFPMPGLIFGAAGWLYGSTLGGGPTNAGTVYQLTPPRPGSTGSEAVLWAFTGGSDGGTPNGGLVIGGAGKLYGTTQGGGQGFGAIFELAPPAKQGNSWTEKILHSFAAESDGAVPYSGLTLGRAGMLYGTTASGGSAASGLCENYGEANTCGVVFQVAP